MDERLLISPKALSDSERSTAPTSEGGWRRSPDRSTWIILALALAWTAFVGGLAIGRHDDLRSNAFDLGYVNQTLWNTVHGRPFQFSTLINAGFQVEGVDPSKIHHPGWLLAFHVEPALLLVAPFYLLWQDPRLLLWLQALVIALGALPATWLGRAVFNTRAAGFTFGITYLLAPALEGASLSDFHMVALAAPLLMMALFFLETGHWKSALTLFAVVALCREDAAATVAWTGLLLLVRSRFRRPAGGASVPARLSLVMFAGAGLWTAICFGVITPFFNGQGSVFWSRYTWIAADPLQAVLTLLRDPAPLALWLASPDVRSYLLLQLLTSGILAILAPVELLSALPILAINALSQFEWMRSGGGHYSALLVPLLLWAAIMGSHRCARWFGSSRQESEAVVPAQHLPSSAKDWLLRMPLACILASATAAQLWIGVWPLRPGFTWHARDERAASVEAALRTIPPDVALSASSGLYPHVSNRRLAYWFPAQAPGAWIAVDVAGTTHPLSPADAHEMVLELLNEHQFTVVNATSGLLILQPTPRNSTESQVSTALPDRFFDFVRQPAVPATAKRIGPVRFGPNLELVAYSLQRWPTVALFGDSGALDTYWRVGSPVSEDLHFSLAATGRENGSLIGLQADIAAGALWYPTSQWRPGEIAHLRMPIDRLRNVRALGITVTRGSGERLPVASPGPAWESGTIAEVTEIQ